jgi:hypothetical protein
MEKIFHVKGEMFEQISIFTDHIKCRNGTISVVLLPEDIGCIDYFNGQLCQDTECRHHIHCPELGNCVLNNEKEMTLEEIGEVMGFSREAARLNEAQALINSRKKLKSMNKHLVWETSDFIDTYDEGPPNNRISKYLTRERKFAR